MTGISHALISWFVAQGGGESLRDRRLVAWLGVAPDFDVLPGFLYGSLTGRHHEAFLLHRQIHHTYTHGFAMVGAGILLCLVVARNRLRTALLAGCTILLHVLCDVIGSGSDWPVFLWWPVSRASLTVSWSFTLYSWPNHAIQISLVVAAIIYTILMKRSPLEMFSAQLERDVIQLIERRKAA